MQKEYSERPYIEVSDGPVPTDKAERTKHFIETATPPWNGPDGEKYAQKAREVILEYLGDLNRTDISNTTEDILRYNLREFDRQNYSTEKRDYWVKRTLEIIPDEYDPRYFDISRQEYEAQKARKQRALDEFAVDMDFEKLMDSVWCDR